MASPQLAREPTLILRRAPPRIQVSEGEIAEERDKGYKSDGDGKIQVDREEESEAKANRDADIGHPVLDLSTPSARPCQEHSLSHSSELQPSALVYPWRKDRGCIGLGYLRASGTKAKEKEFPGRSATSRWRQRAKTEWEKLSYTVCETLRVTPCVSR